MGKVVIDARFWGIKHTGLGRYTENLVRNLLVVDGRNDYVILARRGDKEMFIRELSGVEIVEAEAGHYSISEQFLLPWILKGIRPDILHVPHFNVPIFWLGRIVVTIHDLITHEFRGKRQTTLTPSVYWLKYVAHQLVFWVAVKKATRIIVPTVWVKERLIRTYSLRAEKVVVSPEAVEPVYFEKGTKVMAEKVVRDYKVTGSFLIYTGNAYEHKNLRRLVLAVKEARIKLVVVCARSIFRDRFEKEVREIGADDLVVFLENVVDKNLRELYRQAVAFVTPSLSEGFGLSGLEAMAAGTIVLSSKATCLPEVYGQSAIFFDPLDVGEMVEKIGEVKLLTKSERATRIRKGIKHASKFSWKKTAEITADAYEQVMKDL